MRAVEVPIIAVLHTVLAHPTAGQRAVLEAVGALAASIVVMTATARALLLRHYAVPVRKVVLIPHGVHEARVAPPTHARGRNVLTWGLIGPGKGIEWGIRAMGRLADAEADADDRAPAHYTVLGETHPKVLAHEGERYRDHLHSVIDELGLHDSVTLDDRYLDADSLALAVAAADVVLLPYDSREQVTSGVLVEAIAAGLPVVATAFPHAIELLDRGPGIVVEHEDPAAIAAALLTVFQGRAPTGASDVVPAVADATWAEVAERYAVLAAELRSEVAA
jgi:glycosyltransferase involved in cell wall biosynthesis